MSHTCPYNGKHRFPTQSDAVRAARRMNNQHKGLPSVYFCTHCNSWHLTHYSYRDGKYIREYQRQQKQERKKQKTEEEMKIYLETNSPLANIRVDLMPPDSTANANTLRLSIITAAGSTDTFLDINQTMELQEALQIQTRKMIK